MAEFVNVRDEKRGLWINVDLDDLVARRPPAMKFCRPVERLRAFLIRTEVEKRTLLNPREIEG